MKLKIELTDRYNVTSSAEHYIDLTNETSVQEAFITLVRVLERGGWTVPADLKEEMVNYFAGKDL